MNLLTELIKYHWTAKHRHGIHSPFVYALSDRCFSKELSKEFLHTEKDLFARFLRSTTKISVNDLGKGSRKLKKNRTVRDTFKTSSCRGKKGQVLYRLSNYFRPSNILELGTSLGIGTWYLNQGFPEAHITTIEGCSETLGVARELNPVFDLDQVHSFNCSFETFLDTCPPNTTFDLIYIDGHHDGKALLHYLDLLEKHSDDETLFILDDIRWSRDMLDAWKTIIQLPSYHVTVDLFHQGLVWKRSQQEKEHFVLRC